MRPARDPTLARHIYDLHVIRDIFDAADVAPLAREVMIADAQLRGRSYPAYQSDPLAETLNAVDGIVADAEFAANYAAFQRNMVYGDAPEFATALKTLKTIAQRLR